MRETNGISDPTMVRKPIYGRGGKVDQADRGVDRNGQEHNSGRIGSVPAEGRSSLELKQKVWVTFLNKDTFLVNEFSS